MHNKSRKGWCINRGSAISSVDFVLKFGMVGWSSQEAKNAIRDQGDKQLVAQNKHDMTQPQDKKSNYQNVLTRIGWKSFMASWIHFQEPRKSSHV